MRRIILSALLFLALAAVSLAAILGSVKADDETKHDPTRTLASDDGGDEPDHDCLSEPDPEEPDAEICDADDDGVPDDTSPTPVDGARPSLCANVRPGCCQRCCQTAMTTPMIGPGSLILDTNVGRSSQNAFE